MIRQYAIEPECLDTWERFRFILDSCGAHNGRVIVKFPKDWQSRLEKLLDNQGRAGATFIQHRSIVEKLIKAQKQKKFVTRDDLSNNAYLGNRTWVQNALAEHGKRPFDGIVAGQVGSADEKGCLMQIDRLDSDHPHWKVQRSVKVKRTPKEIAKLVAPLLQISQSVRLVDPYFLFLNKGSNELSVNFRHLNVLREVMLLCRSQKFSLIEYHCGDQKTEMLPANWESIKIKVRSALPRCAEAKLVLWPQDSLHNRFILTNVGGIQFGTGLDESTNARRPTDDVSLLDLDHYESLWEDYKKAQRPLVREIVNIEIDSGRSW